MRLFIKKRIAFILSLLLLVLFPVLIGLVYKADFFKNIGLTISDVLSFYGVALGIFLSFWKYSEDKSRQKKEHEDAVRPKILISAVNKTSRIDFEIFNQGSLPLSSIYFNGEFICNNLGANKSKPVSALIPDNDYGNDDFEIPCIWLSANDIKSGENYPKSIHICCDDHEGTSWECTFNRYGDDEMARYCPEGYYLL